MANCNQQFIYFDSVIELKPDRIQKLKSARKNLRDRIRNDFRIKRPNEIKPKFWSQGSFVMGTSVNPIPRIEKVDGKDTTLYKYDVDDGIYFIGKESQRKSVELYHSWIYEAVEGYTDTSPIDKYTCIRTVYKDGHHIDQPIYFEGEDRQSDPKLAHGKKGWIDSDPRAFAEWFNGHANQHPQLIRIVRYLKAWCDYINYVAGSKKMPSGLVMTIWPPNRHPITIGTTCRCNKQFKT